MILAVLSIVGGFIELPDAWAHMQIFTNFIHTALPPVSVMQVSTYSEFIIEIISGVIALLGVFIAYVIFLRKPQTADTFATSPAGSLLHRLWFADWGFDWLYDMLFVRPYKWIAKANKNDFIDLLYVAVAKLSQILNLILATTQTGRVRWYAAGVTAGAIIVIAILVLS